MTEGKVIPLSAHQVQERSCTDCRMAVVSLVTGSLVCTVFDEQILDEHTASTCDAYEE